MCSSPLDFRLGVLTVVGEESVSAALHQHGECDSNHLNLTVSVICRPLMVVRQSVTLTSLLTFTTTFLTMLCVQPVNIWGHRFALAQLASRRGASSRLAGQRQLRVNACNVLAFKSHQLRSTLIFTYMISAVCVKFNDN